MTEYPLCMKVSMLINNMLSLGFFLWNSNKQKGELDENWNTHYSFDF